MHLVVTPSYGRDYPSAKAAKAAWFEGKDFTIAGPLSESGRQVNKDDVGPTDSIQIRYKRLTGVCVVKPGEKPPKPAPTSISNPGS